MSTPFRKQSAVAHPAVVGARRADATSDSAFLRALGMRVRAVRKEHGLSRRCMAELADVSERYLAQLESGAGNASTILLRRVARALGVRVSDLFGELGREQYLITRFV